MRLKRALRDCKQRSLTVRKKAPTVSEKLGGHFGPKKKIFSRPPPSSLQTSLRHLSPPPSSSDTPRPLPSIFSKKHPPPPATCSNASFFSPSPNRKNKKYPKRPPRKASPKTFSLSLRGFVVEEGNLLDLVDFDAEIEISHESPRQPKPNKGQFMNFSQGSRLSFPATGPPHPGTDFKVPGSPMHHRFRHLLEGFSKGS